MAVKLRVVARKEDLAEEAAGWEAAAVIDVLRATSTIAVACANGAEAVYPCASREEAERRAAELRAAGVACLLAGEAGALPIPGFDLGNSPRDFTPEAVAGRAIVLLTTNGTRALRALAGHAGGAGAGDPAGPAAGGGGAPGRLVVAASFLNAGAVAALLRERLRGGGDALLVCAGTAGRFSLDDFLCAGCLVDLLARGSGGEGGEEAWELDDLALAARDAFRQNRERLPEALASCRHAGALREAGLGDDVAFCARQDAFDVVPVLAAGRLVSLSLPPMPSGGLPAR